MSGRALDPELKSFVDELNARAVAATPTIEERRSGAVTMLSEFRAITDDHAARRATVRSDELWFGSVPARRYAPEAADRGRPTVAFIHGGGFTTGTLESYDPDCRLLALELDATVVSIGYRLAPEHPFPAGLEDCLTVVQALAGHVRGAFGIAGDSAGGNLALAVSLALRHEVRGPDAQLLLYPAIDPDALDNASYRENGTGFLLTSDDMRFYYEAYLGGAETGVVELGSPSRATTFAGLPPTVLVSAGFDPLRDESRDLGRRLVDDDVEVHYLANPTLTHGFQQLVPRIPAAQAALARSYEAFRHLLERSG